MKKLIVQTPFVENGVHYHQGAEYRPAKEEDAAKRTKSGEVRAKVFAKPGVSAAPKPAPRKMKTQNAEEKLATQTVEKDAAEQKKEAEPEEKPARSGKRSLLSPKKND